jgi:5-deoxy-glucuronate isomerase
VADGLLRYAGGELSFGENRLADALGITLSVYRLRAGERAAPSTSGQETALVSLAGAGRLVASTRELSFRRTSWIEQSPAVVHAGADAELTIVADEPCEVACVQTANPERFAECFHDPNDVATEHRGKGKLGDTAYRLVRTVFDRQTAPEVARLVVGEVIAFPGRWSSYPPHHHRQPELYYYRFAPERGYGHAEHGDLVHKVQQHDVLAIMPGRDHAQAAAPGYHMYYLWAIRHLDQDPYTGFEYSEAHRWTFEEPPNQKE